MDMHFAQTMGIPMMHQGMMQTGQIMGQLGGEALRANQPNPYYYPVQPINPSGQVAFGGTPAGIPGAAMGYLGQQQALGPGNIRGRTAEKGGRVPKTGTYKQSLCQARRIFSGVRASH